MRGSKAAAARRRSPFANRSSSPQRRLALLLLGAPVLLLTASVVFRQSRATSEPYRRLTRSRKHISRQHYVGPVQEDAFGLLADISYIGLPEVDKQLGCPAATHGCFYSFADDAGESISVVQCCGRNTCLHAAPPLTLHGIALAD